MSAQTRYHTLQTYWGVAFLAVSLAAFPVDTRSQPAISWFTVDGGGGVSTGGVYAISGTVGQTDAAPPMSGGLYSLPGGFWAAIAVQVADAPVLTIAGAGPGQALISWQPNPSGFVLQETASLPVPNWTNSPSGATQPVTVPTTGSLKFYRLFKP